MSIDYYLVEQTFTEEERMVRDTIRQFVRKEFGPRVVECYRQGTFPLELIPRMGELGIFGADLEGYSCAGLGSVAYGLMCQELEYGDSGLRSMCSVQTSLVMYPIWKYGSEEQKRLWLPKMARGEAIGCFGLTEPDHGSDPGSMNTRAEKTADGWLLRGAKSWITNGNLAEVAVVWAKTGGDAASIRGFLVPKDAPGFSVREITGKLSLRCSITSELFFDEVRLPDDAILPGAEGLAGPLRCLNEARYSIAWGVTGAAMACFDEARRYVTERTQFGKPIGAFQLTQQKLADMLTEIVKAQLLSLRLGRLKDEGKVRHQMISLAKRNNVHEALKIARVARGMLGANGVSDEFPVMRHMCNLESVYTYEGTHEIHTLVLGRDLTGQNAFGGE